MYLHTLVMPKLPHYIYLFFCIGDQDKLLRAVMNEAKSLTNAERYMYLRLAYVQKNKHASTCTVHVKIESLFRLRARFHY